MPFLYVTLPKVNKAKVFPIKESIIHYAFNVVLKTFSPLKPVENHLQEKKVLNVFFVSLLPYWST